MQRLILIGRNENRSHSVGMKRLLLLSLLLPGLASCGAEDTHTDRQAKLLTYRGSDEVCTTDSTFCVSWTEKALLCEENLANAVPGTACTDMENYREMVTGVALSSAPGAYAF